MNRKVKKESRYTRGRTRWHKASMTLFEWSKGHQRRKTSFKQRSEPTRYKGGGDVNINREPSHTFVKLVATLILSSPCALSRGSPLAVSSIIWFCARKSVTSRWPKSLAHADPSLAIKYGSIWRYTDGVSHSMLGMLCGTTRFGAAVAGGSAPLIRTMTVQS